MATVEVSPDYLHELMETAIQEPKGNGFVDCLVHFSRLVTGDYLPGDVEGMIDVDLDDCTPEYRKEWIKTYNMIARKLTKLTEED